ncbi:Diguanylate cyclase DosC [Pigmentiphaga humi]|uniref:Diguanylate cyclase DosC n=1 Tax=Pigmentiphaga humi TaxID=2478468 RepID=A0A3P4B261_9BURK|nr:GGDEF domain-containing protein [Pigmentiphaga humi]VCU69656.1 Diguanylate cyclase DosC [Pigmentiphaga humi]
MSKDNYFSEERISAEWQELMGRLTPESPALLSSLVHKLARVLADDFYSHMLADPHASIFLSSEQVHERLHGSLQKWAIQVLGSHSPDAIDGLIAAQLQVGTIHARIGIPSNLVARGARRLKLRLLERLAAAQTDEATRRICMIYVSQVLDICMEAMTASYARSRERSAKSDEAYRLFSLTQNLNTERERQRASLLDWENTLVYQIAIGAPMADTGNLSSSTFGLWFTHKGVPSFGENSEIEAISTLIADVDATLAVARQQADTPALRASVLRSVRTGISSIKQLLGSLFAQMSELESGRDALTQLMNRRFLPTVLRREVSLAMRSEGAFALIMVDVDHFKAINDNHGHAAGDVALQRVAAALLNGLRSSDYAFRYGGEEFLLVLVETLAPEAYAVAERLRRQIEQEPTVLADGTVLNVTISAGVAMHTGHPDYERTLAAADAALYMAKKLGRNRTELAEAADGRIAGR